MSYRAPVEGDLEFCPVGAFQEPNLHCVHWYDGGACCRCNLDPSPDEHRSEEQRRWRLALGSMHISALAPVDVVCPRCRAAISAKCTEPKPAGIGGFHFVEYFHEERIALAGRTA